MWISEFGYVLARANMNSWTTVWPSFIFNHMVTNGEKETDNEFTYLARFGPRIWDRWILPLGFSSQMCSFLARRRSFHRYRPGSSPSSRHRRHPGRLPWRRSVASYWIASGLAERSTENMDYRFALKTDKRANISRQAMTNINRKCSYSSAVRHYVIQYQRSE